MTEQQGSYDVIVIGGGVVGCMTAYTLCRRGLRIALVERDTIGQGTSDNSFAWINATSKTGDEAYHRLNALGARGYRELAADWGEDRVGIHPSGMVQWAGPADPARLHQIEARKERLDAWGYPAAWVGHGDLVAMEPHVRFEDGAEGLHAIADAWLDVPTLLGFLAAELRAGGATVHENCAARELLLSEEGRVRGLRGDAGDLTAAHVIVASGPSTPEVMAALTGYDPFATRFPMNRAPGLLVRTPSLAPYRLARRILYTDDPGDLHIRPTPDGGLLLGADDTDGLAAAAADGEPVPETALREGALKLLTRTQRYLPSFAGAELIDQCQLKVGVRPVPADGQSIAGPMPGADGLYLALTHSGVTLAPALGKLLADTIQSGQTAPELLLFTFDRFQSIA